MERGEIANSAESIFELFLLLHLVSTSDTAKKVQSQNTCTVYIPLQFFPPIIQILSPSHAGCNTSSSSPRSTSSDPFSVFEGGASSPNKVSSASTSSYENVTVTEATLGRTAMLECRADNMSGKKMVSWI